MKDITPRWRQLVIVMGAAVGLWLALLLVFWPGRSLQSETAELRQLAAADGIEIVTADPGFPIKTYHGLINGSAAGADELANYVPLFLREFELYPPQLIHRAKIRRVVLCRNLSFAGQLRNAIPDFEHDTLYYEVCRGSHGRAYLRGVVHHEFFHIVDYLDDGELYRDNGWSALNPAAFKYGTGGVNAQDDPTTSLLTDRYPGFLNHYSTTGVEEDKAEVFSNLIARTFYVQQRMATDQVLSAKVTRMKALMHSFCPEIDDGFWTKAAQPRE